MAGINERTSAIRGLAGATLLAIGLVAFVVVMTYIGTHDNGLPERARDVIGTSGHIAYVPEGEHTNVVPASAADKAVINELETITGAADDRALIGRHVELLADLAGATAANADASGRFWIGAAETPVLVVLERDRRSDEQRVTGEAADIRIPSVRRDEPLAISGRVQRLPAPEAMYGWQLTRHEKELLADRPFYISAESARPAS